MDKYMREELAFTLKRELRVKKGFYNHNYYDVLWQGAGYLGSVQMMLK